MLAQAGASYPHLRRHLVLVRYQDLDFANNKVTLVGATKETLGSLPEFKYAG